MCDRRSSDAESADRLGVAERREDLLRAIGEHGRRLVERHAAGHRDARRERERRSRGERRRTRRPRARARRASASVSPAAASIAGDGVSPAASAAASGSPPGSAAATVERGRRPLRPDPSSRQRRITRSTAGSRSRTIDDGVVTVPVSCSCFRSPSVFAS